MYDLKRLQREAIHETHFTYSIFLSVDLQVFSMILCQRSTKYMYRIVCSLDESMIAGPKVH